MYSSPPPHLTLPLAPHGPTFWKWAKIAENGINSNIKVTTCHSYEIKTPFKFTCTNECCGQEYGRHSKKGIDVNKQVCGQCRSALEYSGKVNPDGTVRYGAMGLFDVHVLTYL